jgi:hypothetical protein
MNGQGLGTQYTVPLTKDGFQEYLEQFQPISVQPASRSAVLGSSLASQEWSPQASSAGMSVPTIGAGRVNATYIEVDGFSGESLASPPKRVFGPVPPPYMQHEESAEGSERSSVRMAGSGNGGHSRGAYDLTGLILRPAQQPKPSS